jgi:soluble lytic murein transglycosylase
VKQLNGRYAEDRSKVFAAYNAGIQTVENWVSRRLFEDQLVFIELIPYQETRDYVKGVWRNEMVYRFLLEKVPGLPN